MTLFTTLARAQAVAAGRAQPVATVRHRHLSERPMVFVPLTTAGEVGAPLGAMVGTDRDDPALLVVPQPRDRTLRFAFLADLAAHLLPHLSGYEDVVEHEPGKETDPATGRKVTVERQLCADAPQLIVANPAVVEYVRLLGRSTRFRRTAEEDPAAPHPVPSRVPLLGRWLTHYGERARTPGSALLVTMTQLLARHWATGQSAAEDQHLGALLAWIDPPDGLDGATAARRAESARGADGLLLTPPAGPATDPVFDNVALAPAMARYDAARESGGDPGPAEREIRDLLAGQLRPTWDAVWHGVDLLRTLPEAAHAAERWKGDRWSFTGHRDRVRAGEPPQPRLDDAVTAARKLAGRETAQARLDAQEALDDPLVMAERRLAGEAFAGRVTAVEMAYSEGRVARPRPLVTVEVADRPLLAEGAKVYRALPDGRTQEAEFTGGTAPGALTLRLLGGMGRGKVPDAGTVPVVGDQVCWTLFEHAPRGGPELPDAEATPWTHGGPSGPGAATPEPADAPTADDFL
ncbi:MULTISPECIES: hypothetical protein [Streptomycetaceae]|uniref:Uncharacterized protein n=1 Tax=Streptantibioticus cattleyicolor (strain ATCC 35852 / DSM 46488 / JCM 4925 / NBRC 14057 / NRRL 8057) TaxID=1003195 RepID=F8JT94_STREN|nr:MULTISPECIES: hypothetical protein [Streptomycetaceae]AEW94242.1 hypothetical protein SCATT_18710 [Streptantibioticus cattleyicolor NRRL 8057 = DSM 46488]MYS58900.1 hypothetical protein [Streptomyces sp. SID5468]CCB74597.1 conserved protein of unknown function [Streptantibioticus cattleyicolor NRRL 8057 = DSM 46488]